LQDRSEAAATAQMPMTRTATAGGLVAAVVAGDAAAPANA